MTTLSDGRFLGWKLTASAINFHLSLTCFLLKIFSSRDNGLDKHYQRHSFVVNDFSTSDSQNEARYLSI